MPTYKITDPKTGKTLQVTSNRQPTLQEAKNIFSENTKQFQTQTQQALSLGIDPFSASEEEIANRISEQQELNFLSGTVKSTDKKPKLTEEELKKDQSWIESSKKIYALNEGEDALGLDSDEQYADYGLRYMGWFNYNLPKMSLEATQLTRATDEQKNAFVNLMDMYDQKQASFAGFGRAIKGLSTDPSTYLGIGTFGAATAGTQAIKQGIKEGVKQATKAGIKQGAKVGALEGAVYTATDNAIRQSTRITAGQQENFDIGENLKSAAFGGAIGSGLGGGLGGFGSNVAARTERAVQQDNFIKQTQKELQEEQEIAESIYDWADAVTGQEPSKATYSRTLAENARDDLAETSPDVQADINLGLNKDIIDAGIEILQELGIPRNPKVQISDQIFDALSSIEETPLLKGKFDEVLKRNNIKDPLDLLQLFKIAASDSGKRLNRLSVAQRKLQNIADDISNNIPNEKWSETIIRKFGDNIYALDNIRRGLLVSQIATSMRNFTAQIGRVGMHTTTNILDNVLNQTFNPIRRLFGKETIPVDHTQSLKLFANLTTDIKKSKEITDFVTDYFIGEKDRLFYNYASDVAKATDSKPFVAAQRMVDALNTLNRMQEYFYRRGMFAASLDDTLRKRGININDVIKNNDISKINQADVTKAVDDALKFTYALTPDNFLLKGFVDIVNKAPFLATGLLPFPRFMANAIEFQFRHSPLGFTSLLFPKEIAAIANGDMKKLSQAMLGTGLLMGAIEAKRRGFGGEKWYELKGTDGTTIDARPYFPLTPYLLVADLVVRAEDGRIPPDSKDIIQGLSGAQFRAGAGLALVDNLINDISGIDSEEKIRKAVSRFTSDVLGGYLTPFRMFNDFVDQQQEFRTTFPTGTIQGDISEQLGTSIPFYREKFAEVKSPTREATPGRPETVRLPFTNLELPGPLTRQLTGVTVREAKNPAEKEIDRLGLKRRDVLPYTGDRQADQLLAKHMGQPVELLISELVVSDYYKNLNNPSKEAIMREVLREIRADAKKLAEAEDPKRFAKISYNRLSKNLRKIIERNLQN